MKMNKKQVLSTLALSTLALSTLALAQAGYVSADELAPIDSSAPTTEVVTPTAPSTSTETEAPAVQPTAPSASTETEAPAVQPTEPSVTPVDPTTPDTSSTTDKGEPAIQPALPEAVVTNKGTPEVQPELPKAELPKAELPKAELPKAELPKAELPKAEKPKTTDEANEQGKSQIGTTSTATGQVVHDVTKAPVETNTGASIVSTQDGNVVLSDGSVVAPEEIGGTVNEDKTISVTDKEGKLKTLPNTGTAKSILTTIGGMLMTAVGYFYKKKLF